MVLQTIERTGLQHIPVAAASCRRPDDARRCGAGSRPQKLKFPKRSQLQPESEHDKRPITPIMFRESPSMPREAVWGMLFVQQVRAKRGVSRQTALRLASLAMNPVDFCGPSDKKRSRKSQGPSCAAACSGRHKSKGAGSGAGWGWKRGRQMVRGVSGKGKRG